MSMRSNKTFLLPLIRRFSQSATDLARQKLLNKVEALSLTSAAPLTHQSFAGRKRFYKMVGVKQIEQDKFAVQLDGKTLRTPARNNLHLPTYELALGIAAEWDAQTDARKGIEPVTMPLMTLASTAIDQVSLDPSVTIANCLKYLHTDSSLFFTHEGDRILFKKQKDSLQPAVEWLNSLLDIRLQTTTEMARRIDHPQEVVDKVSNLLEGMDHFTLTCLQSATMECKSLVLGLATISRALSLDQVKIASRLEEEFQVEIWGVVEGGHDMDRLNNSVSLSSVVTFMALSKTSTALRTILPKAQ